MRKYTLSVAALLLILGQVAADSVYFLIVLDKVVFHGDENGER